MAYETGKTGIGDSVSNHYGPRKQGNQEGTYHTKSAVREALFNFDGDSLKSPVVIPKGAQVIGWVDLGVTGGTVAGVKLVYDDDSTVAVTGATGGAGAIKLTKDAVAAVPQTSDPADITPTGGSIVIQYILVA